MGRFDNIEVVQPKAVTPTGRFADIPVVQPTQPVEVVQATDKEPIYKRAGEFISKDILGGGVNDETNLAGDIFRSTVGSRGLAGVAQMPGKVISQLGILKSSRELSDSQRKLAEITTEAIKKARNEQDQNKKQRLLNVVESNLQTLGLGNEAFNELKKEILTPRETVSTSANAALTALTGSGSVTANIGRNLVGRTSVSTLQKLPKLLPAVEKTLTVGKGVIPRAIEQAGIGAGFTVSENIRQGKSIGENVVTGAVSGAALPFAGTVADKGLNKLSNIKDKLPEKIINSLIKPLLKDLSYGKNPGQRIATEGITFNSLEDGAKKIGQRLDEIGQGMGAILESPDFTNKFYNFSDALKPIDDKIIELQKAPRTNAEVIKRLENAKDDILGRVDNPDGTISYKKDLFQMTAKEAVQFKREVAGLAKYTGNASDDKAFNKALQESARGLDNKIDKLSSELKTLNERWSDLKTAETAIKYRDKIEQRQNLLPYASKTIAGILTGAGAFTMNPALIAAGVAEVGLDKLMSSAVFKTRLAKWLAKSSQIEKESLIRDTPVLKQIFDKIFGEKSNKIKIPSAKSEITAPSLAQIRSVLDRYEKDKGQLLLKEGDPSKIAIPLTQARAGYVGKDTSGIIENAPKPRVLPQEPRPGQVLLPKNASPKPLITPAPTYTEPQAKKIGFVNKTKKDTPVEEMITLYHASPKQPKTGNWRNGTYFADSEQKASYYAGSHHTGDITIQKVTLPKSAVFKEPSTGNYTLKQEYPIKDSVVGKPKTQLELAKELNQDVLSNVRTNSLIQEAKKYKTAEEFVNNSGEKLLHGSEFKFTKFDFNKSGNNLSAYKTKNKIISLTDDIGVANKYGSNIVETYIEPTKIKEIKNLPLGGKQLDDVIEQAKKEGYSAVSGYKSLAGSTNMEDGSKVVFVFDEKAVKTKSQLEQIWKEANKKATVKLPKKK